MFKTKYLMGPDELQVAQAFIILPWDFKVLYGVISDTIPIPGLAHASKKGYLILFSTVQFVCLLMAAAVDFSSAEVLIHLFFTCSLCGAFMDVVIDGIATI